MPEYVAREAVTAAALRGDATMLASAYETLGQLEAYRYDRERVAAFLAALEGARDGALEHLERGGAVAAQRRAVDVAIVDLLLGEPARALAELRLGLHDAKRIEPDLPPVLAECYRRGGGRPRDAIAVAVGRGTPAQRVRSAVALLPLVGRRTIEATVAAASLAALVVAILAFARIPSPFDDSDSAIPVLRDPGPVVVVAQPRRPEERARARPSRDADAESSSALVAARRPSARRPVRPAVTRRPPSAPAAAPAAPRVRVLVRTGTANRIGSTAAAAPAPQSPSSTSEQHGQAQGHEKPTKGKPAKGKPAAPAPPAAPESSPAEAAASSGPGPSAHEPGYGRDDAPGQTKKP